MKHVDITPYINKAMDKKLRALISRKRYVHSVGVAKTAAYLAQKYGYSPEKAAIAGFVHDCTKDFTRPQAEKYIKEFDIKMDDVSKQVKELWHSFTAPYGAKLIFGIKDTEILRAIKKHTAGSVKMSGLEKIIYVADYTEYNRKYMSSIRLRKLLKVRKTSLDMLVKNVVKEKMIYLLKSGLKIHRSTIELWNEISKV